MIFFFPDGVPRELSKITQRARSVRNTVASLDKPNKIESISLVILELFDNMPHAESTLKLEKLDLHY